MATVTETKKKLKGTKEIKDYTMIYNIVPQNIRAISGVAVMIRNTWIKNSKLSYMLRENCHSNVENIQKSSNYY